MPLEQGSLTLALVTAGSAFLLCLLLVPLFARWAPLAGLLDRPGGHKTHDGDVPVVGGIAICLATLGSALYFSPPLPATHWGFLGAIFLLLAVGVIDDRRHVAPRLRLGLQTLVVAGTFVLLDFKVESLGNLLGTGPIELGAFVLPFAILATVALINAFNMVDGLDGLAGGVALVAMLALCALSLQEAKPLLAMVAAASAGSIVGFLFYNLPLPIRGERLVFMGDAGSTLLGFIIATLCMGLMVGQGTDLRFHDLDANLHPPELLWLVAIPVFEICTTTLRRMRAQMSPMQADTGHYHHRLRQAGWSVRNIFLLYVLFSVAAMLVGVSLHRLGAPDPLAFWSFMACYGLWHAAVVGAERRGLRRQALAPASPG